MGTPLTHSPFTHYWGYGILIASLLTAILMLWGVTLRRLVKQRTSQLYTERTRLRMVKALPLPFPPGSRAEAELGPISTHGGEAALPTTAVGLTLLLLQLALPFAER